MVELPLGLVIDFASFWLNELYIQCIPDFEALSNTKLSATFSLFTDKLWIATSTTYTACKSWIKLLFYLCRLMIHIILLSYPKIKPIFVESYSYWNSLDLTVQLSIIGFILFICISYYIKKNHYIQRTNNYFHLKSHKIKNYFNLKYHKLISWISTRSKMTAKIFPHLLWWFTLFTLIWFIPEHTYASHHVLLFIGCFIIPSVKTYTVIRKYSNFINLYSNTEDSQKKQFLECINPLQIWLQFWCCRSFVIFSYYICCYILSYIPGFIITSINNYVYINNTLFEIICDWAILSLLVTHDSLTFFSQELTTKIFQINNNIDQRTEIRSNMNRERSLADKISLSSINSLLQFMLKFIGPFVPTFIYNIIHDGLYQFLIFFTFLFFSVILGSYILGYLLPIYTSILALNNLKQLQYKISCWNNNRRYNLITPETSEINSPQKISVNNLRSRKNGKIINTNTNINVLSPEKNENNPSWSLWSLIPSNMFSFHGNDEFDKNQRKRQKLHEEANHIINTIVNRLKYWVVFSCIEWIYYFIGEQIGLENWIPLWNYIKFALILWIQLPYVPYSCVKIYEYIILPVRILDINHVDIHQKKDDDINDKSVIINNNGFVEKYDDSMSENKRKDVNEEKSKLLT